MQVSCIRLRFYHFPHLPKNHHLIVRLSSLHTKHRTIYLYVCFFLAHAIHPAAVYSVGSYEYTCPLFYSFCSIYSLFALYVYLVYLLVCCFYNNDDLRIVCEKNPYYILNNVHMCVSFRGLFSPCCLDLLCFLKILNLRNLHRFLLFICGPRARSMNSQFCYSHGFIHLRSIHMYSHTIFCISFKLA